MIASVLYASRREGEIPLIMEGGRAVLIYKGEGPRREVGNSRGIIIQTFLAKLHGRWLISVIDQAFLQYIIETRCATSGRGNAMAGKIAGLFAAWLRQ